MYDKKELTNEKIEFHKYEEVLSNIIILERPSAKIVFETFYEYYENKYGKKHPIFRKIIVRYKGVELSQTIFFFTDVREAQDTYLFLSKVYKETLKQLQIALKKIDMAKSPIEDYQQLLSNKKEPSNESTKILQSKEII